MPNEVVSNRIVELYTVQHLTLREIGSIAGISHASVANVLKRAGVTSQAGERVSVGCVVCGVAFSKPRSRWKRSTKHYCSSACYGASLHNAGYMDASSHRSLSRQVVRQYHDLQPQEVVHHHDSDPTNTSVANLAVFASQAEHMSFQRSGKGRPIWDGRVQPCEVLTTAE